MCSLISIRQRTEPISRRQSTTTRCLSRVGWIQLMNREGKIGLLWFKSLKEAPKKCLIKSKTKLTKTMHKINRESVMVLQIWL